MRVVAISSTDSPSAKLLECQRLGYLTFIYHHADPTHALLRDKFMYVHDDEELSDKLRLLELDFTAKDLIQL